MDSGKLQLWLSKNGQPKYRFRQIKKAVFQDGISSFGEISTIPKDLREKLVENFPLLSFEILQTLMSKKDASAKSLLRLADGNLIETVLISPKPGIWSACISCQVGCQMGCRFCATGKLGFVRNLSTEEISDQVLFWRQYLKTKNQKLSTVVFMGMGEPFNNWEEVSRSIQIFTDKDLFGLGSRNISVSTSGIAAGIEKMAREFPQVNLALSLHFANDKLRSAHMPVNQKDKLKNLQQALAGYLGKTKRKVFLEYILLENINDSLEHAQALKKFIGEIRDGYLLHVNLIRYNITEGNYRPSTREAAHNFKRELLKMGVPATIRKSLGEEIRGACGQLAGK